MYMYLLMQKVVGAVCYTRDATRFLWIDALNMQMISRFFNIMWRDSNNDSIWVGLSEGSFVDCLQGEGKLTPHRAHQRNF